MKIAQVNVFFNPYMVGGAEWYVYNVSRQLTLMGHEVHVFTREENPFAPDYAIRRACDADDPRVALHLVNMPRSRDRYRHAGVDQRFAEVLDTVRPDVVHVGHLNHLSTSPSHPSNACNGWTSSARRRACWRPRRQAVVEAVPGGYMMN